VTNKVRVQHQGPLTALAQLLADHLQRTSYSWCKGILDRWDSAARCTPLSDDHHQFLI